MNFEWRHSGNTWEMHKSGAPRDSKPVDTLKCDPTTLDYVDSRGERRGRNFDDATYSLEQLALQPKSGARPKRKGNRS